jgi:hypothetical protein
VLISVFMTSPVLVLYLIYIAWFALLGIDNYLVINDNLAYCLLAALNPATAFRLGAEVVATSDVQSKLLEFPQPPHIPLISIRSEGGLGWTDLFADPLHPFSVGYAFVMLLADTGLLLLLIYYVDAVLPTDDSPRRHPLFFLKVVPKCGSVYL